MNKDDEWKIPFLKFALYSVKSFHKKVIHTIFSVVSRAIKASLYGDKLCRELLLQYLL